VPGLAQPVGFGVGATRAEASRKLKRRARKEGTDKSRPAPVQAREMGGPKAGLIERPSNDSDEPASSTRSATRTCSRSGPGSKATGSTRPSCRASGQCGIELHPATSDPVEEYPLARPSPLITDRNSLVTSGCCRGQDPETPAARLSRDRQECTARSDDVVQLWKGYLA
jgi:hypothetical protein